LAAARLMEQAGEYLRAIECYAAVRAWDALLMCVEAFSAAFSAEEKDAFIGKYVPIALNDLLRQLSPGAENPEIEEWEEREKQFEAIKEESSEEEGEEEVP